MKRAIIITMLLLVLLIPVVFATYTITRTAPAAYAIMNDTTVAFGVNATGSNTSFNCSLYLKTASTDNFTENLTFAVTNNTDTGNSANFTLADGDRVWWKIGCYDRVGGTNTTNEEQTIVSNNTAMSFDHSTDGVVWVTGWVNYTHPITNENITLGANNSGIELANNGSIATISSAVATIDSLETDEVVTIPANNLVVQLSFNHSVTGVSSAKVIVNSTENLTLSVGNYSVIEGIVYMNTTDYEGNSSYWTYYHELNRSMVEGVDYSLTGNNSLFVNSSTYEGNETYWNYEYYNATGLVLDTDYSVVGTTVYINTTDSDYTGDVSYWNYSYPGDNKVDEANTTIRILDVDDYYNEFIEIFMPIKLTGSAAAPTCDTTSAGAIYYDTDGFRHYGCNSTDWTALYNG